MLPRSRREGPVPCGNRNNVKDEKKDVLQITACGKYKAEGTARPDYRV